LASSMCAPLSWRVPRSLPATTRDPTRPLPWSESQTETLPAPPRGSDVGGAKTPDRGDEGAVEGKESPTRVATRFGRHRLRRDRALGSPPGVPGVSTHRRSLPAQPAGDCSERCCHGAVELPQILPDTLGQCGALGLGAEYRQEDQRNGLGLAEKLFAR